MHALKIGDLAKRTHTDVQTVRFYEKEGLLPVTIRSEGNYRLYGEEHVERLSFIRNCRSLDMKLEEILVLLQFRDMPNEQCGAVNDLLDEHIDHVETRIAELRKLQKHLKALRECCQDNQAVKNCGILNGLSMEGTEASAAAHTKVTHNHVPGVHRSLRKIEPR